MYFLDDVAHSVEMGSLVTSRADADRKILSLDMMISRYGHLSMLERRAGLPWKRSAHQVLSLVW